MTHSLTRTSPKGGPFFGQCIKCGQLNLPASAATRPCPCDAIVSDDQALVFLVNKDVDSS